MIMDCVGKGAVTFKLSPHYANINIQMAMLIAFRLCHEAKILKN